MQKKVATQRSIDVSRKALLGCETSVYFKFMTSC